MAIQSDIMAMVDITDTMTVTEVRAAMNPLRRQADSQTRVRS